MNKTITIALLLLLQITARTTQAQTDEKPKPQYGKNLLAISPVALTEQGVAVGLTYEHALDEKGLLHFSLPAFYTFNSTDDHGPYGPTTSYASIYPGLKIYPTGYRGRVRYGVGPALQVAYGKGTYYNRYYDSGGRHLTIGMMVTNSLNIQFTPKYYFGAELGLGISYVNRVGGYNDGTIMLGRMGFSFGYRF